MASQNLFHGDNFALQVAHNEGKIYAEIHHYAPGKLQRSQPATLTTAEFRTTRDTT